MGISSTYIISLSRSLIHSYKLVCVLVTSLTRIDSDVGRLTFPIQWTEKKEKSTFTVQHVPQRIGPLALCFGPVRCRTNMYSTQTESRSIPSQESVWLGSKERKEEYVYRGRRELCLGIPLSHSQAVINWLYYLNTSPFFLKSIQTIKTPLKVLLLDHDDSSKIQM